MPSHFAILVAVRARSCICIAWDASERGKAMSYPKTDRKIQSSAAISLPESQGVLPNKALARILSDALHREYGKTHAAIKTVAGLTEANDRAVKNWFEAVNGPGGPHMIALMRHSDEVFETVMLLAGRRELLVRKKLLDARAKLERMLQLLDELD